MHYSFLSPPVLIDTGVGSCSVFSEHGVQMPFPHTDSIPFRYSMMRSRLLLPCGVVLLCVLRRRQYHGGLLLRNTSPHFIIRALSLHNKSPGDSEKLKQETFPKLLFMEAVTSHPCIPKISRARLEERRPPAADTYLSSQGPHSSQSVWELRMRGHCPLS